MEQALNDYLRVGGTYVEESQANEDYTLRGVDVELSNQSAGQSQGDFEGRLRLEYAESESEAQGNFISTDGGISFTELSTQDDSGGAAYSIEGDVRLFNRAGLRGYYKWIDKEFSTSSISSQQGKEMFGVSGVYDLSSRTQVRAGFDVQNLLDQGNLQTQLQVGAEKSTTTYLQVMHQIRKLKLTGEYRRQEVEQEDARFESENNQESDTVALRADYAVNEKLDVSLQQQVGDDNTQTTLGAEYRPNEQLALRVSETVGSDGTATQLGITNRINDRVDISGDYTLTNTSEKGVGQVASLSASAEVDEKTKATATVAGSSDHTSTMSFGTERKMSEDLTVKTDRSFVQSKDQTTTGENFSLVKNYKNQQWEGRFGQQVSNQEDQTSEANIYGLSGNVNDWLSLTGNYERGVVQHHSGEQSDRQAIALGVGMVHQDKVSGETLVKSSTKVEMRFDDGSNDIRQSFLYQLVEGKVSEDITVYAKAELSKTRNTTTEAVLERYKELEIGGAYRPVAHDRLNVLGSYTYLSEQSPGSQTDNADIEEERAHVLAGELIYDLSDRWQVAEKFAYRMGDEKVSGFGFTKTETWLQAHRLAYKIDERWKLAGEYRRLTQREAEDVNQGFLIEGIMRIDDSTEAGVGYNFTDFNDDLTDLDYTSQGPYVRVTGAFYDQTLDEIRRAKLKIEQGESARKLKKEKERHIEELNQKIKELRAEARDFDKSGNSVLAKSKRKEAKDLLKECRQAKKYLKLINKDVQREEEREAEPEFLKEARKLQAEGTELFEQGRYVQAEEKFKALLTLQEKVLAERAQREKQRQQEEKLKAQQIKKEREELRQIYKEALRLYRRKEYEQAQSQFKEIHVKAPDYKGTRRYLKRIEEKLKQQE